MPTLVKLVPYDPDWPREFESAETRLHDLLRDDVLAIDHIGSTAIPEMPAKPLIDIDVTLTDLQAVSRASKALVGAGFEPRGNRYDDDMWAFLLKSATPPLRVYLFPRDNKTHRDRMLFRDYLRRHPDTAAQYAALKGRLAAEFPNDGDRYTSEKRCFVYDILERASAIEVPNDETKAALEEARAMRLARRKTTEGA